MRHPLLRTLFQPGVSILYPCFPTGCSGNSNFGFCNKFLFPGAGYQPAAQPPTWRTRGCSSSGLYPSTNPAWLDLPGTTVPAGTALRVIETHKLHHHDKVSAHTCGCLVLPECNIASRATQSNSVYVSVLQISTVHSDGVRKLLCQNFFSYERPLSTQEKYYIIYYIILCYVKLCYILYYIILYYIIFLAYGWCAGNLN